MTATKRKTATATKAKPAADADRILRLTRRVGKLERRVDNIGNFLASAIGRHPEGEKP
jgi:hypothetical protein